LNFAQDWTSGALPLRPRRKGKNYTLATSVQYKKAGHLIKIMQSTGIKPVHEYALFNGLIDSERPDAETEFGMTIHSTSILLIHSSTAYCLLFTVDF